MSLVPLTTVREYMLAPVRMKLCGFLVHSPSDQKPVPCVRMRTCFMTRSRADGREDQALWWREVIQRQAQAHRQPVFRSRWVGCGGGEGVHCPLSRYPSRGYTLQI